MRLLLISLAAVLVTALLLVMTRFWGLSQAYQTFEHPFLTQDKPFLAVKVSSVSDAKAVLGHSKAVIFWLDLAKTQDGFFLVSNSENKLQLTPELLKNNFRGSKTFLYNLKF